MKPTFLILEVTERCNGKCVMCHMWRKKNKKELDLSKFSKLLENESFSSLWWVNITGGEPFLREDIADIVKILCEKCKSLKGISIPTNGLLTDIIVKSTESMLNELGNTFLSVTVSIDCFEKVHDMIRGVPGIFKKAITTLERLSNINRDNFATGVETVVFDKNISQLEEFYNYLRNFTDHISIVPVSFSENYFDNVNFSKELSLSRDNINRLILFLQKISLKESAYAYYYYKLRDILIHKKRTLPCLAGYRTMYIDALCRVHLCHYLPKSFCIGNATEGTINSIWFSKKANDIRRRIKTTEYCKMCSNDCDLANIITQEFFDFGFFLLKKRGFIKKIIEEVSRKKYLMGYLK